MMSWMAGETCVAALKHAFPPTAGAHCFFSRPVDCTVVVVRAGSGMQHP